MGFFVIPALLTEVDTAQITDGAITDAKLGLSEMTFELDAFHYDSIVQGTFAASLIAASQIGAGIIESGIVQNDEIVYKIYLPAGTYNLNWFALKHSSGGQIRCAITGGGLTDQLTSLSPVETYNNSLVYNFTFDGGTFTTTVADIVAIHFKAATKNGASGGYKLNFTRIFIQKG